MKYLILLLLFLPSVLFSQEIKHVEVEIDNGEFSLLGTLTLPKRGDDWPVVLFIGGSGQTDRDGNQYQKIGVHCDAYKIVADELANKYIASLRYDKRSIPRADTFPGGDDITFEDFVTDAKACIKFLKEDGRFETIVVLGHSQGSLVGMLAIEDEPVSGFISVAGAGRSIDHILYDQLKEQVPDSTAIRSMLDNIKAGKYNEQLTGMFSMKNQVFLNEWMQYVPTEEIAKMDIPVSILQGDNDIQVPVMEGRLLDEAAKESRMFIMESMNHVLRVAPRPRVFNMATYMMPELPIHYDFVDYVRVMLREMD